MAFTDVIIPTKVRAAPSLRFSRKQIKSLTCARQFPRVLTDPPTPHAPNLQMSKVWVTEMIWYAQVRCASQVLSDSKIHVCTQASWFSAGVSGSCCWYFIPWLLEQLWKVRKLALLSLVMVMNLMALVDEKPVELMLFSRIYCPALCHMVSVHPLNPLS